MADTVFKTSENIQFLVNQTDENTIRRSLHKLRKLFSVRIGFENGHVTDYPEKQWISIEGNTRKSTSDAKDYILALCHPETESSFPLRNHFGDLENILDGEILENIEKDSTAVIVCSGKELKISGSNVAVALAVSALENLARSIPSTVDSNINNHHSDGNECDGGVAERQLLHTCLNRVPSQHGTGACNSGLLFQSSTGKCSFPRRMSSDLDKDEDIDDSALFDFHIVRPADAAPSTMFPGTSTATHHHIHTLETRSHLHKTISGKAAQLSGDCMMIETDGPVDVSKHVQRVDSVAQKLTSTKIFSGSANNSSWQGEALSGKKTSGEDQLTLQGRGKEYLLNLGLGVGYTAEEVDEGFLYLNIHNQNPTGSEFLSMLGKIKEEKKNIGLDCSEAIAIKNPPSTTPRRPFGSQALSTLNDSVIVVKDSPLPRDSSRHPVISGSIPVRKTAVAQTSSMMNDNAIVAEESLVSRDNFCHPFVSGKTSLRRTVAGQTSNVMNDSVIVVDESPVPRDNSRYSFVSGLSDKELAEMKKTQEENEQKFWSQQQQQQSSEVQSKPTLRQRRHSGEEAKSKTDVILGRERRSLTPEGRHTAPIIGSKRKQNFSDDEHQTCVMKPWGKQMTDSSNDIQAQSSKRELRYIVIDGSNVACEHGNGKVYSCRGIEIAVNFFWELGHKVMVFVPEWRRYRPQDQFGNKVVKDSNILEKLNERGLLKFTPARRVGGKSIASYDDRFILRLAEAEDGIIVSNDQYRDLINEKPSWRKLIEERLLQFTFVNDHFMPPDDPLGRNGPLLQEFLQKSSGDTKQLNRAGDAPDLRTNKFSSNQASFKNQHNIVIAPSYRKTVFEPSRHAQNVNQQQEGVIQNPSNGAYPETFPSNVRSPEATQRLFQDLVVIFSDPAQAGKIREILSNHPSETDLNRLSNYCMGALT